MSTWIYGSDARFIYDGWNVVAEVELHGAAWDAPGGTSAMTPRPAYVRRSWVWGEDVSGTLDGAGGVGGLLVVTRHARGGQGRESYWAMSDLNGNVTGLVSTTSGRMAVYEYDAFGRLLRENEPEPGLNPVRFSSKYQDVETGLVYYGYRYYAPEMGRWISRDPIEEQGGVNLYGMVGNDAVNRMDVMGMIYRDYVTGRYSDLLSRRLGGREFKPRFDSAPLAAVLLEFYLARNAIMLGGASGSDVLLIGSSSWIKPIQEHVDKTVVKEFFASSIIKYAKITGQATSPGESITYRVGQDVGYLAPIWERLSLQGATVGIDMTCTQPNGFHCAGVCTAVVSLYDRYDFLPNDDWQEPLYLLAEYIPSHVLGVAVPFQVAAQWRAKYEFEAGFKLSFEKAKHEIIK